MNRSLDSSHQDEFNNSISSQKYWIFIKI